MATTTAPIQLDRRIRTTLKSLRRRIRAYVWIQGAAAVLAVLGALFWISLAADWFFEPPVLVRKGVLAATVLLVAAVAYRLIGRRAFESLPDPGMAILLERRFNEFDGALLTAVELTARPPDPNDCNRELLEATCRSAVEPIGRIRLADVFNPRPLRLAVSAALLLAAAIAVFQAVAPEALAVWYRRSVLMSNELWPRRTRLAVEGFSDGVAQVARGDDFTLIVKADMQARLVPRTVRIRYRPEGGSRLDATMIREGQAVPGRDRHQEFSHTFPGVLAPIDLDLRGGDASIRNLRIEVVDAPTLVRLQAECRYPPYMQRPKRVVPAAGIVPIPRGTEVTLFGEANKRLVSLEVDDGDSVQLVADDGFRQLRDCLEEQRALTRDARSDGDLQEFPDRQRAIAAKLTAAHETIASRLVQRNAGQANGQHLQQLIRLRDEMLMVAENPGASESELLTGFCSRLDEFLDALGGILAFPQFNYRLQPLAASKTLELTLHDVDGIRSRQPIRVILSAVEDQSPQPAVRLRGIGSAITPQARLPLLGEVTDDHGIHTVWLEYAVGGREPRRHPLRELDGIATRVPVDDAFEVDPLGLEPGQKLLAAVKADDLYDLGEGPNVGTGDRWMLEVVTPEKLRAMLEAREIVLRQRFETIVEDVEGIRDTLSNLGFDDAPEEEAADSAEPGDANRVDSAERRRAIRLLRVQRARQNGQKDSYEIAGVSEAFFNIRLELLNNRIYTEELRIRIEQDIVSPLNRLIATDFVQLDEGLAQLESAHDAGERSSALRDSAVARTDTILQTMREVLSRMVELEDFNEAVQLLRSIIEEQGEIRKAIQERRKAKLRQLLED